MAKKKVTKKKPKQYEFKGYDMAEMFQAVNLEKGCFDPPLKADQDKFISFTEEDKFRESELDRLFKWAYDSETNLDYLEDLFRRYLEKFLPMEKKYHYHYPLWVGLSKIKERDCFLKYFRVLFFFMWN